MVTLTPERPEHGPGIERLLDQAFGEARRHKTCQRLRDGNRPAAGLSLVALAGDALIGSVRLWPVAVGRGRRALMLGPLAVDAAWQGEGVGSELMEAALAKARAAGEGAIILVGDPAFYGRFGFSRDLTSGLWLPGPVERPRFLARELERGALTGAQGPVRKLAA